MYDIAALGELLIDFTPAGKNERGILLFERNPGGAPANVLAMAESLGAKTAFIGKVGQDMFGSYLKETLDTCGIHTSGLVVCANVNTTLAFVALDEHGDRSFSFYRKPGADILLTEAEVKKDLIANSKVFHFGSVSLTDEPCRCATLAAAHYAQECGKLISFDPNYRPPLWKSQEAAKAEILHAMPLANILKVSYEELCLLTGEQALEAGAQKLASYGPSLVLVSCGALGAFYYTASVHALLPTYHVPTVDTTGAGDAFLGAALYRLKDKDVASLHALSGNELDDILDFANAAGSLTTTKRGAIPAMPTAFEIAACRKSIPLFPPQFHA